MVAIPLRRKYSDKDGDWWIQTIWQSYLKRLRTEPLKTKALTAAAVFALSDVLSQLIRRTPFSVKRMLTVALWGLVWGGPSQHYWQAFMQRMSPRTDMKTILAKVTADQLTFGPFNNLMNIAFFTVLVEDQGFDHLRHKIVNEYPSIQLNGWKLWPAAAMFNYRFVPLNVRVLFLNLVALGWTTFLSVTASSSAPPPMLDFKEA